MRTQWWNAQIKEAATEDLVNASVILTTKELPVKELFAPIAAVMPEFASPNNSWLQRLDAHTLLLGMQKSKLAACVILEGADPIALFLNARLALMC